MQYFKPSPNRQDAPMVARVRSAANGSYSAVGAFEHQNMPLFAPRGIRFLPHAEENVLLLPVSGGNVCLGVLFSPQGLSAGELQLTSSGGATIHLKNNGDIVLNGRVIKKDGTFV